MKSILITIAATCLIITTNLDAQNVSIKNIWSTKAVLNTPESVLLSNTHEILFVSNITGNPTEKNSLGYISKLSTTGDVIDKQWITNIDAPKGMAQINNSLFVSNIDELIEIDIRKSKIVNKYPIAGSIFLNDVVADKNGNIYISDMKDQTIYILENKKITTWLKSDLLENVNGLCVVGENLYTGTKNTILEIGIDTKIPTIWANNTGSIDGLEHDGINGFFYSDWKGHVYHIKKAGNRKLLIDTTDKNINAADIGINLNDKIIYVPTFSDNRVMAYKFQIE